MGAKTSVLPPRPKKRNREESTKRILQAGLDVFAELGYDAATTKMIAKRAGLNESLIQRYFTSKSNLLVEVTHACFDALQNENPYPPAETPEEEIRRFLLHKFENDRRNFDFQRVLISRLIIDPQARESMHRRKKTPLDLFFRKRLELFQKKGMIRADLKIDELATLIIAHSMVIGVFDRLLMDRSIKSCKKQFRLFAKYLAHGIVSDFPRRSMVELVD